MRDALSPRQRQILDFLLGFRSRHGCSPTVREIAKHFGLRSPGSVTPQLQAMIRKGFLRKSRLGSRNLEVPFHPPSSRQSSGLRRAGTGIPILGSVAAGAPVLSEENMEGSLDLRSLFGGHDVFSIRIRGHSMQGAGIFDGDLVVVRPTPSIPSGKIALVVIDGEATVKRIFRKGDTLRLKPENPDFPVLELSAPRSGAERNVRVVGEVVGLVRTRIV